MIACAVETSICVKKQMIGEMTELGRMRMSKSSRTARLRTFYIQATRRQCLRYQRSRALGSKTFAIEATEVLAN